MSDQVVWGLQSRESGDTGSMERAQRQYFVPYLPVNEMQRSEHRYHVCGQEYCDALYDALEGAQSSIFLTGLHFMRDFCLKREPQHYPDVGPWEDGNPVQVVGDDQVRSIAGASSDLIHYNVSRSRMERLELPGRLSDPEPVQTPYTHYTLGNVLKRKADAGVKIYLLVNQFWPNEFLLNLRLTQEDKLSLAKVLDLIPARLNREPPPYVNEALDRPLEEWIAEWGFELPEIDVRIERGRGTPIPLPALRVGGDTEGRDPVGSDPESYEIGRKLIALADSMGLSVPTTSLRDMLEYLGITTDKLESLSRWLLGSPLFRLGANALGQLLIEVGGLRVKLAKDGGLFGYMKENFALFEWLSPWDAPHENIVVRTAIHPAEGFHSHHQKIVLIDSDAPPGVGSPVAFYGGIDLTHIDGDRWDSYPRHDAQVRSHFGRVYKYWHDIAGHSTNPDVIQFFADNIQCRWREARRNGKLRRLRSLTGRDELLEYLEHRHPDPEDALRKAREWLPGRDLSGRDQVLVSEIDWGPDGPPAGEDPQTGPGYQAIADPVQLPYGDSGPQLSFSREHRYEVDLHEAAEGDPGAVPTLPLVQVVRSMPESQYQAPEWNQARPWDRNQEPPGWSACARFNKWRQECLREWDRRLGISDPRPWGNEWEASAKEAYLVGIHLAQKYIYLENQWLSDIDLMRALLDKAKQKARDPNFRMIIVEPTKPLAAADFGLKNTLPGMGRAQLHFVAQIAKHLGPLGQPDGTKGPSRFGVFCINQYYQPYAHYGRLLSRLFEALRGFCAYGPDAADNQKEFRHRLSWALSELRNVMAQIRDEMAMWACGEYHSDLHPGYIGIDATEALLATVEAEFMHPVSDERDPRRRMNDFIEKLWHDMDYLMACCEAGGEDVDPSGFFQEGHSCLSLARGLQPHIEQLGARFTEVYIHSKIMIVDDIWAICGSANAGGISLQGAIEPHRPDTEIALVVLDEGPESQPAELFRRICRAHLGEAPGDYLQASARLFAVAEEDRLNCNPNQASPDRNAIVSFHPQLHPQAVATVPSAPPPTGQNPAPHECQLVLYQGAEAPSWSYRPDTHDLVLRIARHNLNHLYVEFWEYDGPGFWQRMPDRSQPGGRLPIEMSSVTDGAGEWQELVIPIPPTLDINEALGILPGDMAQTTAEYVRGFVAGGLAYVDEHEPESGLDSARGFLEGGMQDLDERFWDGVQEVDRDREAFLAAQERAYADAVGEFAERGVLGVLELGFSIYTSPLEGTQLYSSPVNGLDLIRVDADYFVPVTIEGKPIVFEAQHVDIFRRGQLWYGRIEMGEATNLSSLAVEFWDYDSALADVADPDERLPFPYGANGRMRVQVPGPDDRRRSDAGRFIEFLIPPGVDTTEAREHEDGDVDLYFKLFSDAGQRREFFNSYEWEGGGSGVREIPWSYFQGPGTLNHYEVIFEEEAGELVYRPRSRPTMLTSRSTVEPYDFGFYRFGVAGQRYVARYVWEVRVTPGDIRLVVYVQQTATRSGPGEPLQSEVTWRMEQLHEGQDPSPTDAGLFEPDRPATEYPDAFDQHRRGNARLRPQMPRLGPFPKLVHLYLVDGDKETELLEVRGQASQGLLCRLDVADFRSEDFEAVRMSATTRGGNNQSLPVEVERLGQENALIGRFELPTDFDATSEGWLSLRAELDHRGKTTYVMSADIDLVGAATRLQVRQQGEAAAERIVWRERELDRWPALPLVADALGEDGAVLHENLEVKWRLQGPFTEEQRSPFELPSERTALEVLSLEPAAWPWVGSDGVELQVTAVKGNNDRLTGTTPVQVQRRLHHLILYRLDENEQLTPIDLAEELVMTPEQQNVMLEVHAADEAGNDMGRVDGTWTVEGTLERLAAPQRDGVGRCLISRGSDFRSAKRAAVTVSLRDDWELPQALNIRAEAAARVVVFQPMRFVERGGSAQLQPEQELPTVQLAATGTGAELAFGELSQPLLSGCWYELLADTPLTLEGLREARQSRDGERWVQLENTYERERLEASGQQAMLARCIKTPLGEGVFGRVEAVLQDEAGGGSQTKMLRYRTTHERPQEAPPTPVTVELVRKRGDSRQEALSSPDTEPVRVEISGSEGQSEVLAGGDWYQVRVTPARYAINRIATRVAEELGSASGQASLSPGPIFQAMPQAESMPGLLKLRLVDHQDDDRTYVVTVNYRTTEMADLEREVTVNVDELRIRRLRQETGRRLSGERSTIEVEVELSNERPAELTLPGRHKFLAEAWYDIEVRAGRTALQIVEPPLDEEHHGRWFNFEGRTSVQLVLQDAGGHQFHLEMSYTTDARFTV